MTGKRYTKTGDVASRKITDEYILVPICRRVGDLENIYTLSDVSARIWELLDRISTIDELSKAVVDEYTVEAEEAATDIKDFLQALVSVNMLREE